MSRNPRNLCRESSSLVSTSLTHSGDDEDPEDSGIISLFLCAEISGIFLQNLAPKRLRPALRARAPQRPARASSAREPSASPAPAQREPAQREPSASQQRERSASAARAQRERSASAAQRERAARQRTSIPTPRSRRARSRHHRSRSARDAGTPMARARHARAGIGRPTSSGRAEGNSEIHTNRPKLPQTGDPDRPLV